MNFLPFARMPLRVEAANQDSGTSAGTGQCH